MFLTISLYASLASALVNPGFIILFQIPCWSLNSIAHAPHVPGTPSGQCLPRLPSHSTPLTMTLPYLSPSDRLPLHSLKYFRYLTPIHHHPFLENKKGNKLKVGQHLQPLPLVARFLRHILEASVHAVIIDVRTTVPSKHCQVFLCVNGYFYLFLAKECLFVLLGLRRQAFVLL